MAKLDDEVKTLRSDVEELKRDLKQLNFNLVRLIGKIDNMPTGGGGGGSGSVSVDLGPIERRIDEILGKTLSRADVQELYEKLDQLTSSKVIEAEKTIERTTVLLERGLQLVDMESSLNDLQSLLEETILGDFE